MFRTISLDLGFSTDEPLFGSSYVTSMVSAKSQLYVSSGPVAVGLGHVNASIAVAQYTPHKQAAAAFFVSPKTQFIIENNSLHLSTTEMQVEKTRLTTVYFLAQMVAPAHSEIRTNLQKALAASPPKHTKHAQAAPRCFTLLPLNGWPSSIKSNKWPRLAVQQDYSTSVRQLSSNHNVAQTALPYLAKQCALLPPNCPTQTRAYPRLRVTPFSARPPIVVV